MLDHTHNTYVRCVVSHTRRWEEFWRRWYLDRKTSDAV